MNWINDYVSDKKKKANYLVDNKINWKQDQGGLLNMKVKDVCGGPMKFKTSIQGKYFVLKCYDSPSYSTNGGVWAYLTKRQALILARELLDYAGEK